MDLETVAMGLIGNAGEGKSLAFEALAYAKKKDFINARKKLAEAQSKMFEAHHIQTDLIVREADGDKVEMNLILIHAQDHLMNALLAKELIAEMIELYEKI